MKTRLVVSLIVLTSCQWTDAGRADAPLVPEPSAGAYFPKKEYRPAPLPSFASLRDQLPASAVPNDAAEHDENASIFRLVDKSDQGVGP